MFSQYFIPFFLGLIAQSLLFLLLCRFIVRRIEERIKNTDNSEVFSRSLLDVAERNARNVSELKETLLEKLSKGHLDSLERVERTLSQNRQELHTGLENTRKALEIKFQSLESQMGIRLQSIGESVENKLNENLKSGFKHFEKVQQHLQAAELKLASLNTVGQSISDLNNLLKLPHLRGGFGEATLERLLSDFLPKSAYDFQVSLGSHSQERVDAIVKIGTHVLPIDSKFPREQVLPLFEATDPKSLEVARKTLADVIKIQAKSISQKYIRPEDGTTDMALLFLPSETLYFEIIRNTALFENLSRLKVFPVSPNTLAVSLRSVAMAREYYEMAKGVESTIEEVKKARKHFSHFEKKFEDVGKGLKKAQEAFETAQVHLGRYGTRVFRLTQTEEIGSDVSSKKIDANPTRNLPSAEV